MASIHEHLGSIWAPTTQPERKKGKETETKERTKEHAFSLPDTSLPLPFLFLLSQNNPGPCFLGLGTKLVKHKADVRNTRATQRTQNGRRWNMEMVRHLSNAKARISNCRVAPKEEHTHQPHQKSWRINYRGQNYTTWDSRERRNEPRLGNAIVI